MTETPYQVFRRVAEVDHGHCRNGCAKPQPVLDRNGWLVCCWCAAPMVPCGPEVCERQGKKS